MFIVGCSASKPSSSPLTQSSSYTTRITTYENLKDLIVESVKLEYGISPNNYEIKQIQNKEDLTFITFVLKDEKDNYHGILVASRNQEKYSLVIVDMRKIDYSKLVNVSIVTGHASENSRAFMVVTGYLDSKIRTIDIQYPNGQFNVVRLDTNDNTYMDVTIGSQEQPVQIYGLDTQNNKLFTWK